MRDVFTAILLQSITTKRKSMVAFNVRVLLFIEAFTSNPIATSKQKLSDLKIKNCYCKHYKRSNYNPNRMLRFFSDFSNYH